MQLNIKINNYIGQYIINILKMISNADKYRQIIQDATKRIILFPNVDNLQKKLTEALQCNIKLPSSHPFRSSQQIEKNISISHNITHQSSKQQPKSLNDNWPKSSIGLVLCQHHQKNQTFYVYGTGILIHNNIVLTSAQNVYCRRLKIQYTNIRFIVGISGDKCSGIYDVKRVHYPKEYTMYEEYENYNFAGLQLNDNLTKCCGYVRWKTDYKPESKKLITYGYINEKQAGSFKLREGTKHEKSQDDQEYYSGSGVLFKDNENRYYIVGLQNILERKEYITMSEKIRSMINQWTHLTKIDLTNKNIGAQGCKYLSQTKFTHLTAMNLRNNNIGSQGCKYLSQTNWTQLTTIILDNNQIESQGCKYLSQANWAHLTAINLSSNNIDAQGCKYLSSARWIRLNIIQLYNNQIDSQGCKYLSQANWIHVTTIQLWNNKIDAQGCKYLSQANWTHLTKMNLYKNNIGAQGCKYLSQANWTHLYTIDLMNNNIDDIVYRLLLLQLYPNDIIKI